MGSLWTWLNTPPALDDVLDPFTLVYAVVFLTGFVVSAWLSGSGAARLGNDPVQTAGLLHWSNVGLWIFGPGMFFLGVRLLQINPLSFGEPIWMAGSVIALVVAAVRCLRWWRGSFMQNAPL